MLGNTAADYFCCNLEKLSMLLRLPPTVAGVTLLPFGNGAPDVFASITAFLGPGGAGEVGLNCVLGGAVFVTCVVIGSVSFFVSRRNVRIDGKCFVRDVGFFLFTLVSLSLILLDGKVCIWEAVLFILIYVIYGFVVVVNKLLGTNVLELDMMSPMLPVRLGLDEMVRSSSFDDETSCDTPHLPHWLWGSHVAIFSSYRMRGSSFEMKAPFWGWNHDGGENTSSSLTSIKVLSFLKKPMILVRSLTIPIVEEERWSKAYAVASASISPILLAFLLDGGDNNATKVSTTSYIVGGTFGLVFGVLSFLFTKTDHPPQRFLLPWVLGGFVMSIVWFYIIANELVALLISFGVIFKINPSILGLTVLAWGNSMGDFMSSVALAISSRDGVQVAMSGCYAGPMFNTLVGLGMSLLLKAWSVAPLPYLLPRDNSLVFTLSFLMLGLLWSLFVLPKNDMRPNTTLGFGLILLYLVFLSIRICIATGILKIISMR